MRIRYLLLGLLLLATSCREEVNTDTSPQNVFDLLWKTLDERYCFFDSKAIDWNEVHDRYQLQIDTCSGQESLYRILGAMVCELRDGHVNLYNAKDLIRYWKWFEDYPKNYDQDIVDVYLGSDYGISGGLNYKNLSKKVGYINYQSFSSSLSESGMDYIFLKFKDCKGIILDVRNNSGGDLSNMSKLAARFTETRQIGMYLSHKTGPKHNDFSELYPVWIEPSDRILWLKKVVILTNRLCYSATNTFVCVMKNFPQVTTLGDRTGGGGGFPIGSSLPNGWLVRFSACPTFDSRKQPIEDGIDPDIAVSLSATSGLPPKDNLIEAAMRLIEAEP